VLFHKNTFGPKKFEIDFAPNAKHILWANMASGHNRLLRQLLSDVFWLITLSLVSIL
jgi:hypothetical protein